MTSSHYVTRFLMENSLTLPQLSYRLDLGLAQLPNIRGGSVMKWTLSRQLSFVSLGTIVPEQKLTDRSRRGRVCLFG